MFGNGNTKAHTDEVMHNYHQTLQFPAALQSFISSYLTICKYICSYN